MSSTVEKNFSGFVKIVISATGLVAMGAIVAGGSLLKGFREGTKTAKDAERKSDEKTADHSELTPVPADTKRTKDVPANDTSDGSKET
ncbi:MAG: hypothetical protein ACI3W5_14170 [Faecousia sp.]